MILHLAFARNLTHASDSPENAEIEIDLWFRPEEIVQLGSNSFEWIMWR